MGNLRSNKLSDGSEPWVGKEDAITAGTTAQYYRGDKSFQILDKSTVGLANVTNINILNSFTQNPDQIIETTTIKANNSEGLELVNESNQGMVISTFGHVGLGTLIPQERLEIRGNSSNVDDTAIGLRSDASDGWSILRFENTASNGREVKIALGGPTANINPNSLYIQDLTSNVTRFLIDESGRVGINTTAPETLLDVNGDAKINQLSTMEIDSQRAHFESTSFAPLTINTSPGDSGRAFVVLPSGMVGINTTSPMFHLEIFGDINVNGDILQNGSPFGGEQGPPSLLESDRKSVLVTTEDLDVPSSQAVFNYVSSQIIYTSVIPADQLTSVEVSNLKAGVLADGSTPWSGGNINPASIDVSGTATIADILRVNGSADSITELNANSDTNLSQIKFQEAGNTRGAINYYHSSVGNSQRLDLEVNETIRMSIKGDGNVGIGTLTPTSTLDVRGLTPAITVGKTDNSGGALYFGNTNYGIKRSYFNPDDVGLFTTTGDVYLSTNSTATNKFVLKNSGKVGIGISSPVETLHVKSASHTYASIDAGTGALASGLKLKNGSTNQWSIQSRGTLDSGSGVNDNRLVILNNNESSTPMTILQTGGIGIGTDYPSEKLHVAGNIKAIGDIIATGNFISSGNLQANGVLTVNGTTDSITELNAASTSNQSSILFNAATNLKGSIKYVHNAAAVSEQLFFEVGGNPQLNILGTGETTINGDQDSQLNLNATLTPSLGNKSIIRFKKDGTTKGFVAYTYDNTAPANERLDISVNDSLRFSILGDGNVGIGTQTPSEKLHVVGHAIVNNTLFAEHVSLSNFGEARYHLYNNNSVAEWIFGQGSATDNKFTLSKRVGPTESDYFTITESGQMGIGTSSPDSLVHFGDASNQVLVTIQAGSSQTAEHVYKHGGNNKWHVGSKGEAGYRYSFSNENDTSEVMSILQTGGVGIGTFAPSAKLHVNGNTKIEGELEVNGGSANTFQNNKVDATFVFGTKYIHGGATKWDFSSRATAEDNRFGIFNSSTIEVMTLTQDAQGSNVGIGIATPSEKLEVNGVIKATDIKFTDNSQIGDFVGFSVVLGSDVTVPSATDTDLIFATETYDIGGNYNTGTGVFTAPVKGIYTFKAQVNWTSSVDEMTMITRIKNGGTVVAERNIIASGVVSQYGFVDVTLSINQFAQIKVNVRHNAAPDKLASGSIEKTFFQGRLIRQLP